MSGWRGGNLWITDHHSPAGLRLPFDVRIQSTGPEILAIAKQNGSRSNRISVSLKVSVNCLGRSAPSPLLDDVGTTRCPNCRICHVVVVGNGVPHEVSHANELTHPPYPNRYLMTANCIPSSGLWKRTVGMQAVVLKVRHNNFCFTEVALYRRVADHLLREPVPSAVAAPLLQWRHFQRNTGEWKIRYGRWRRGGQLHAEIMEQVRTHTQLMRGRGSTTGLSVTMLVAAMPPTYWPPSVPATGPIFGGPHDQARLRKHPGRRRRPAGELTAWGGVHMHEMEGGVASHLQRC